MRRDGGRPEIDSHAINRAVIKAGPDVHDAWAVLVVAQMDGDRDFPVSLAQNFLQDVQDMQIGDNLVQLPLLQ